MSEHEQNQPRNSVVEREAPGQIANVVMDTIGGATRFGISLATLPLGLLPRQSRDHMHNAIRELSYAFAQLPRDFARIAAEPIEEWITTGERPATRPAASAAAAPTAPDEPTSPTIPNEPSSHTAPATPVASSTPAAPATPPAPAASSPASQSAAAAASSAGAQAENRGPQAQVDKSATGSIEIAFIEYNPIGSDLLGEYVLLRNSGAQAVDMKGWRMVDDAGNTFVFPNFTLAPGAEVRVWTKKGKNGRNDLYWGRTTAAWNNTGDTALLKDASGKEVARYQYEVPKQMRRR